MYFFNPVGYAFKIICPCKGNFTYHWRKLHFNLFKNNCNMVEYLGTRQLFSFAFRSLTSSRPILTPFALCQATIISSRLPLIYVKIERLTSIMSPPALNILSSFEFMLGFMCHIFSAWPAKTRYRPVILEIIDKAPVGNLFSHTTLTLARKLVKAPSFA